MAPTNAAWVLTTCHKAKWDGQEVPIACDLQGPLAPTWPEIGVNYQDWYKNLLCSNYGIPILVDAK